MNKKTNKSKIGKCQICNTDVTDGIFIDVYRGRNDGKEIQVIGLADGIEFHEPCLKRNFHKIKFPPALKEIISEFLK